MSLTIYPLWKTIILLIVIQRSQIPIKCFELIKECEFFINLPEVEMKEHPLYIEAIQVAQTEDK